MKINYIKGDATRPIAEGNKIIAHVCNDIGGWGRGFVLAISARWEEPEKKYREWFRSGIEFTLGKMQLVQVENDIWVANIIGQRDVKKNNSELHPVRYDAIAEGLDHLSGEARRLSASIHMPRIGCGLAGGSWDKIEPIILGKLVEKGISVTVYEF